MRRSPYPGTQSTTDKQVRHATLTPLGSGPVQAHLVTVGAEALFRLDLILVDHTQVAPTRVLRVVVFGEGKPAETREGFKTFKVVERPWRYTHVW
jgi:hypothetical protein